MDRDSACAGWVYCRTRVRACPRSEVSFSEGAFMGDHNRQQLNRRIGFLVKPSLLLVLGVAIATTGCVTRLPHMSPAEPPPAYLYLSESMSKFHGLNILSRLNFGNTFFTLLIVTNFNSTFNFDNIFTFNFIVR